MVARYKHRHFAAWEINEVKIMLKYKDPVTGNFKFTQSAVAKHFKTRAPPATQAATTAGSS